MRTDIIHSVTPNEKKKKTKNNNQNTSIELNTVNIHKSYVDLLLLNCRI